MSSVRCARARAGIGPLPAPHGDRGAERVGEDEAGGAGRGARPPVLARLAGAGRSDQALSSPGSDEAHVLPAAGCVAERLRFRLTLYLPCPTLLCYAVPCRTIAGACHAMP